MGARQNETSLSGFPASEVVQTRRQMEVDGFDRALDRLQLLLFAVRPHTSHDGAHDLMCDGHQPCPSTRKVGSRQRERCSNSCRRRDPNDRQ